MGRGFMLLLVVKYYYHIEIKEDEMGGACRTQRRGNICIQTLDKAS
jgi:hypothetical protein